MTTTGLFGFGVLRFWITDRLQDNATLALGSLHCLFGTYVCLFAPFPFMLCSAFQRGVGLGGTHVIFSC